MNEENEKNESKVQADNDTIAIGGIRIGGNVSGSITIGHGYTAEQVSVLLKQITTTLQPKPFDGRCPYKGLEVFEEEDAELFFGRERLVTELVGRVKESRTVFITGPSGSGKSSLVRAGLIHALKQGAIKGSERWLYETMKPGREPLKDLALAFSRLKSPELEDYFLTHSGETDVLNKCAESVLSGRKDQRFLLFVDQFEEVFTQINQEEERIAFINMLAHAGTVENGRVIVLFAMRSDFVSNCATYPALNELLSQEFRQIGAMQPEELVSAIALPARHVGLPIEDELIARIINDMKGEPGALPLMQFALKDLFEAQQEQGGVIALTLEDYLRHGGIHKSLERHADASLAKLNQNEQELARSIFSGLIEIGRGTQDTKRTALFDELIPANTKAEEVLGIVQKLADARLIITDEQAGKDTVTISHEKLIEAWPWLKKLVNENRDAISLQNEIANDAKEWEEHKRNASYLYSGARLANAREQLLAKKLVLGGSSYAFVQAGSVQQRRGQLMLISGVSIIIALLFLAVLVFSRQSKDYANLARQNAAIANTAQAASTEAVAQQIIAETNEKVAREQTILARSGELSAQSVALREKNLQISLLLGIEAYQTSATTQAFDVLMNNIQTNPQLQRFLNIHTPETYSLTFSPDGKILASNTCRKVDTFVGECLHDETILWNVTTGQPIGLPLTGDVSNVVFSPDGKTLATGSTEIILWDVVTGQRIGQPINSSYFIYSLAFSPDGKILASGGYSQCAENSCAAEIILWDVNTRQPIGLPLRGHAGDVFDMVFSPDGKTLASSSCGKVDAFGQCEQGEIILWNVTTGQPIGLPLSGHPGNVSDMVFSPDGKTLTSGSKDQTIILWDITTRQSSSQTLPDLPGAVYSMVFSLNGKIFALGNRRGTSGTITLWDMKTLQAIGLPLSVETNFLCCLALSPDGTMLASGNGNNTIILWDLEMSQPIGHTLSENTVGNIAFSPQGSIFAAGGQNNTVRLWSMETEQPIGPPLIGHSDLVVSVAFSPDGKTLASGDGNSTIILWNMMTGQPIGLPLKADSGAVTSLRFTPDGKTLISISSDNTIIRWDVATRRSLKRFTGASNDNNIVGMAISPNGKTLALGQRGDRITLWDLETDKRLKTPRLNYGSVVLAFSPDGKTLASSGLNKTIVLFDIMTGQPKGLPLSGHTEWVRSLAFSPNGKMLASGSADETIMLWDVATGQPIGLPLKGHSHPVTGLTFTFDGKTLASRSGEEKILWTIDPLSWIQTTCERAGRNFTQAEWRLYFPNEEYRSTCPQWPLEPEPAATPNPNP